MKFVATDLECSSGCAFGVFTGLYIKKGCLYPPMGKSMRTDYEYMMELADGKICHLTKLRDASRAIRKHGWI